MVKILSVFGAIFIATIAVINQLPDNSVLENKIVRLENELNKIGLFSVNLNERVNELGSGGRTISIPTTIPTSLAEGGTGNTSFTAGSVVFSDGTILTQDNASLFFANSTNRLGVGTTSPAKIIDIGVGNATSTLIIRGGASVGGELIIKSSNGSGCILLTARRGAIDMGASASLETLLSAKVIACP